MNGGKMMVFVWILLGLVVGAVAGIVLMRVRPILGLKNVDSKVNNILKEAETKANQIIHNAEVEAKSFTYEMKQNAEKEIKEMKVELVEAENKLNVREDNINRRDGQIKESVFHNMIQNFDFPEIVECDKLLIYKQLTNTIFQLI
jgi:ribonuclease Y